MQLTILMTLQYRTLSVAALLDVFESLNRLYIAEGMKPFFTIRLLSLSDNEHIEKTFSTYNIETISFQETHDLICIPAFGSDNLAELLKQNRAFIPWLQDQFAKGAEVASYCTGAFLLAASGLLDKKKATTHIDAASLFDKLFPEILVESNEVVTDDGGTYTSGGATNSFMLMLHLIRKFCGNTRALTIAKNFALDLNKHHQICYGTFIPQLAHGDELVYKAQSTIEKHYDCVTTVDEILKELPSSRRNLLRRFKSVTGYTPIEYLQKTRTEAAKKMLEETNKTISEIMFATGYCDMKSFRKLFYKNVGMPPSAYREKFNLQRI